MPSEKFNENITVYGSKADIAAMMDALKTLKLTGAEATDRRTIAGMLYCYNKLKADILYRGNTVWNKTKLLRNFRSMVKSKNMELMTDYTYKFLSLTCGSIAHNNKYGWICEYPTITALRTFFEVNEFGISVLRHVPLWKTDAIEIVEEMNKILGIRIERR